MSLSVHLHLNSYEFLNSYEPVQVRTRVFEAKCVRACVSEFSPAWCVTLTAQNQHEIPQLFSADLPLA